jgi:hypothetical protein
LRELRLKDRRGLDTVPVLRVGEVQSLLARLRVLESPTVQLPLGDPALALPHCVELSVNTSGVREDDLVSFLRRHPGLADVTLERVVIFEAKGFGSWMPILRLNFLATTAAALTHMAEEHVDVREISFESPPSKEALRAVAKLDSLEELFYWALNNPPQELALLPNLRDLEIANLTGRLRCHTRAKVLEFLANPNTPGLVHLAK